MPWKSKKQAAWGNSSSGKKALGAAGVKKWNAATPKGSLKRKYVGKKPATMKLSGLARASKSSY
jgi:hypothetical protein